MPEYSFPMSPERELYSEDAEQAVLSAMLMDERATAKAGQMLKADDFFAARHQTIFAAMLAVRASGVVLDPLTLSNRLEAEGTLEASGGKNYIGYLVDAVPTAANVEYHAEIVREMAERRSLVQLGQDIAAKARDRAITPKDLASSVGSKLVEVATTKGTRGFRRIAAFVTDTVQGIEDRFNNKVPPGVATGYPELDEELVGIRGGELMILAGVPGSGKTALALNVLTNASIAGVEGAMVSAEMSARSLVERVLCNLALIDTHTMRTGRLQPEDFGRLTNAAGYLQKLPLHIDDTALPQIGDIVSRLRYLKTRYPALKLAVVDFIQLVQMPDEDMMALALTKISYALKGVAKELDISVIATCQVDAAAVEKAEEKRPRLHHLRWSQGMREAADFVAIAFRPQMYDPMAPDSIEVWFEKARDLPTFNATLEWVGKYMKVDSAGRREMERAL